MNKNLVWRGILLLLVVGGGLFYLLPTLLSNDGADEGSQGFLSKILPKKMINLGLDLKGGIYLAMEVDLQVAVNNAIHRHMEDLRRRLNDAKVTGFRLENVNSPEIVMTLTDPAATQASANDVLNRYFSETLRVVSNDGGKSVLAFTSDAQAELEEITARQALETIRNRIDMYGVAEPDIRPQAGGRIIIQLPGVSNPQEAIDL
ncbi:MAG: protein translocase subunit SecD, partial [Deltaproteobacteria bacterium]|nr:protein translocase subunit SecD [Deltaproteobacteria bacterium]